MDPINYNLNNDNMNLNLRFPTKESIEANSRE